MSTNLDEIKEALVNIIHLRAEYDKLVDEKKLYESDPEKPWHRRIWDISEKEAPMTAVKLILELHLNENLQFDSSQEFGEETIRLFSVVHSITDNESVWEQALEKHSNSEQAIFRINQVKSLSIEISNALSAIKKI